MNSYYSDTDSARRGSQANDPLSEQIMRRTSTVAKEEPVGGGAGTQRSSFAVSQREPKKYTPPYSDSSGIPYGGGEY